MIKKKQLLRNLPNATAYATIAIGLFVCFEWILDFNLIATIFSGYPRMKFNTAILSVLSGISLYIYNLQPNPQRTLKLRSLTVAAIAFGLAAIIQSLTPTDIGMDAIVRFLAGLDTSAQQNLRTSPLSASVFLMMNISLLVLSFDGKNRSFIPKVIVLCGGLIAYNVIIGYFLGLKIIIFESYEYNTMSYPASIILILMSISILYIRNEYISQILNSQYTAGILVRRLLPFVLLFPIFILWITYQGMNAGLYDDRMSDSIALSINTGTFLAILLFVINSIFKYEILKTKSEKHISQSEELFRKTFSFSPVGKVMMTPDKRFIKCNKAFCSFIGYSEEELFSMTITDITLPEDKDVGREIIDQIVAQRIETGGFRKRYINRKKEIVWGDVSVGLIQGTIAEESFLLLVVQDITERINYENKLRTERDRAMQYFNTSTVMLVVLDIDGNIVRINRRGYEILGYPTGSLSGKNWFDTCIPAEQVTNIRSFYRSLLLNYRIENNRHEHSIITFDGDERKIRWYNSILNDESGNVSGILSSGEDITEQLIIEKALKETEIIFNAFLEHSPIYFFFKDSEIRSLRLSRNFEKMLGMPVENALGKTMFDLFPSDLARSMVEDDKRIMNEKKMISVQEELGGAYYETTKFPIEIEGRPLMLAGFTVDITERKLSQEMLQQEKQYFEQLIESLPGIFYLFTYPELKLKRWNKNLLATLGYSDDELLDKPLFDFHPNDVYLQIRSAWGQAMEHSSTMVEAPLISKNGKKTPYLLTGISVQIDGVAHLMGVGIDITERKQFLEQTIRAKEKAEENDKLKSSFLQNMSHEIRTPLNGILGFVSILKDKEYNSEEEMNECLDIVSSSSYRLLGIVNDVLEISRLDSHTLQIKKEEFSLSEVFLYFNAIYYSIAKEKGFDFFVVMPEELSGVIIRTDKDKFYQIITNLLNNAFKFTHEGSVELGIARHNREICFFVKDTGIGIPKEHLGSIFERFWQFEAFSNMKYGGTGLGLSISLGIAELLGMWFEVESEVNEGTLFRLFVNPEDISFSAKPHEAEAFQKKVNTSPSMVRILVIESEDANYKFFEILLDAKNYRVERASNCSEAIEKIQKEIFDALLIDIQHDSDSLAAIKEIRQHNPKLPIIAQTIYTTQDEFSKAIQAGCNGFVSKPLEKEKLIGTIRKHLR